MKGLVKLKVLAKCWGCGKYHDVSNVSAGKKSNGMKCSCGGYVISPSGKMQVRILENEKIVC